jgi:hypothetical protein
VTSACFWRFLGSTGEQETGSGGRRAGAGPRAAGSERARAGRRPIQAVPPPGLTLPWPGHSALQPAGGGRSGQGRAGQGRAGPKNWPCSPPAGREGEYAPDPTDRRKKPPGRQSRNFLPGRRLACCRTIPVLSPGPGIAHHNMLTCRLLSVFSACGFHEGTKFLHGHLLTDKSLPDHCALISYTPTSFTSPTSSLTSTFCFVLSISAEH